jgi:hypothetical protein
MKTPTEIHPGLTEERLCIIGNIIRERSHAAALKHLPSEGDNTWVLGCRRYQWIRIAILGAAEVEHKEWLSIVEDGSAGTHFVFAVGNVPIRFYRGDPEDAPAKTIDCSPIEEAAMQLAFPGCERKKKERKTHIRIAYSTNEKREVDELTLIVVDEDLNPVGDGWVIPKEPLKIKRFLKREEGKDLGQPPIGSHKPQQEHGEE